MKTNQVIAWVTQRVKILVTGQTDAIEIDRVMQITNQLEARKRKQLVASHLEADIPVRPAEQIDLDKVVSPICIWRCLADLINSTRP